MVSRHSQNMRPARLNRDYVLQTAVELADAQGISAVSMRNLAEELGVVPMALYKHVANKEDLLDGMIDVVVGEIMPGGPLAGGDATTAEPWRGAVKRQILQARQTMLKHPWARGVIETRTSRSPVVLEYLDSIASIFLGGGLTPDLVHHVMHAVGSRVWGFTQDVFETDVEPPPMDPETMAELASRLPSLAAVAGAVSHDNATAVGYGCDDHFEFEFALDILLDGIEQRHATGWKSNVER